MDEFLRAIVERQRAENARIRAAEAERAFRALRAAEEAARRIGESDPSVRRVYLFGSLAHGRFTLSSDIDLGVEGGKGFGWPVEGSDGFFYDVVPLGEARPEIRDAIVAEGRVVYEAGS